MAPRKYDLPHKKLIGSENRTAIEYCFQIALVLMFCSQNYHHSARRDSTPAE